MYTLEKQNIRKAFSQSARCYEEHSHLQQEVGIRLLEKIRTPKLPFNILDIGMGTGWITLKVKDKFPKTKVVGLDSAFGMVECAKRNGLNHIMVADAQSLPFKKETFDLVFSNLIYQWVDNLEDAFRQVYETLKEKGCFYLNCFGEKTLDELFYSLDQSALREGHKPFLVKKAKIKKEGVESALRQSGFKNIETSQEVLRIYFDDLFDLIRWLKNTGANSNSRKAFIGRSWLLRADDFYKNNFRNNERVYATFEVIWAKARK